MIKEFIIKSEKMYDTTKYIKRIFNIAVWIKKRYSLNFKEVTLTYHFTEENKEQDKVTIKFHFHD